MKKILFGLLFLFCLIQLVAQESEYNIKENLILDKLIDEAVEYMIADFNKIPPNKTKDKDEKQIKGVGLLPIKNDINDKFYNRLKSKFSKTKFLLYERNEIEEILKEQSIQNKDFYSKDVRLEIGKLTQWKGVIFGKLNHHIEKKFGKEKIYFELTLNFDNLETGQVVWNEHFTGNKKVQYPMYYFYLGLAIIFMIMLGVNNITRGSKISSLIGSFLVLSALYSVWFFII